MIAPIKLSSPATREFWEIPVLYEDEYLLILDKPAGLAVAPDPLAPDRPSLTALLHHDIAVSKPWAAQRNLSFILPAHRLDAEASGLLLLAKSKTVLSALSCFFGSETPARRFLAVVQGSPGQDHFEATGKLAPHPTLPGITRVDPRKGKRSRSVFSVKERFTGWTLLSCETLTDRPHQLRAHLRALRLPLAGDPAYGGRPLLLSRLKDGYHLKEGREERPLLGRPALHAEQLEMPHPISAAPLSITAPWPKDIAVAVKYLRRYG